MTEGRSRVQQNDLLLHEAVIKNEPDAVREALKRPTDVNCRNNVSRVLFELNLEQESKLYLFYIFFSASRRISHIAGKAEGT